MLEGERLDDTVAEPRQVAASQSQPHSALGIGRQSRRWRNARFHEDFTDTPVLNADELRKPAADLGPNVAVHVFGKARDNVLRVGVGNINGLEPAMVPECQGAVDTDPQGAGAILQYRGSFTARQMD